MTALFASADYALYRAKQQKTGRIAQYTAGLDRQRVSHARSTQELRAAVLKRQFEVYYQPRYCIRDRSVQRLEALVRWRHPRRGLLLPGAFMPQLDSMNLSQRIDRFVLEQVVEDMAAWEQAGLHVPSISLNISAQRLADETLVRDLSDLGPTRERLVLELLEGIDFGTGGGVMLTNVERLKHMGVAIEVDDFGTGHSSPFNILRLHPEGIKIARELVAPIVSDAESRTMVSALAGLGRSLGLRVTAEGAETMAHIEMLAGMGVDEVQGYALSGALSFVEVSENAAMRAAFGVSSVSADLA